MDMSYLLYFHKFQLLVGYDGLRYWIQYFLLHGRRKLETDNEVGGARHCIQTMGAPPPPRNFIVRAERSAAQVLLGKYLLRVF